jgi:hypothetical protein
MLSDNHIQISFCTPDYVVINLQPFCKHGDVNQEQMNNQYEGMHVFIGARGLIPLFRRICLYTCGVCDFTRFLAVNNLKYALILKLPESWYAVVLLKKLVGKTYPD